MIKTFKIKLKTILKNKENQVIIQESVDTTHQLTVLTYQFIKAYCLHCYENSLDIPELDRVFIDRCFSIVGRKDPRGRQSNYELKEHLKKFWNDSFKLENGYSQTCESLFQPFERKDISSLYTVLGYQAIEMETCIENNIVLHFVKRLKKFVRYSTPPEFKTNVLQITKALIENKLYEGLEEWYSKHRNKILPKTFAKDNLNFDLKSKPYSYIKHLIYMERYLEEKNIRSFSVFPLRSSEIPKNIVLDTKYFGYKLIGKSPLNKGTKWISTNQVLVSNEVFQKLPKKKGFEFHHMIRTDGISANILLQEIPELQPEKKTEEPKPKSKSRKKTEETQPSEEPKDNFLYAFQLEEETRKEYLKRGVVGVDPGKHNLVYMVDSEGNKLRYTQPQRQTESKNKKYQKKLERRKRQIQKLEDKLSVFNSRSCFLNKFLDYVRMKYQVSPKLREFYSHFWFREWRFRIFSNRQKSEDNFLNQAEKKFGKKVLAYGDWKGNNFLRNQTSSLGVGMRKILARRFKLFLVDEFRSSKLHSKLGCNYPLENRIIEGVKKHRCLVCPKCSQRNEFFQKSNCFVNRDVNAATNIRRLGIYSLHNKCIPWGFSRKVKWERIKSNPRLFAVIKRD